MKKNLEHEIIKKLMGLLDSAFNDDVYRDMDLFTAINSAENHSVYRLIMKGERDKGTPFYCGSTDTHLVKEDYLDGELVYATIII